MFSQDGCQRGGFWEVVRHVVSSFDLSKTLLVGGGLSVPCSLPGPPCKWLLWCLARVGGFSQCASPNSFMLMLFVLPCKTRNVDKPWSWLARPLPGDQQSQDSFPSLSMVQDLHSQQAVRALTVREASRLFGSRSEACSALSLKPKQDYLLNFPNRVHE